MSAIFDPRRRVVLSALAAGALVVALPRGAFAQDPRSSAAHTASLRWLALVDKGDTAASWKAASDAFRARSTEEQWQKALPASRAPLGALQTRTLVSTQFGSKMQSLPDGEYAMLIYRTVFANRTIGETIVLSHDKDGAWRVVGYQIR